LIPVIGLFFLAFVVPFAIIRPAFALPRLRSPEEVMRDVRPLTLVFNNQVRLLGYQVEPESVTSGEHVQVTLCWEALQPVDQDYTLFIHLLGRDNLRVGERTTYPGQGRFPTTLWPVGHAFCDSYRVDVAPWAPSPEMYALEVGLYDDTTGWRLPASDASGQAIEPPIVGSVRITPNGPLSQPTHTLAYDLGGQIALVGYDSAKPSNAASTDLEAGDTVSITLYWEAVQKPQGHYKVFVHLLDGTGAVVAQDDVAPRDGGYPTRAWQPGDFVPDLHQLTLPDERPPGPYTWWVGMYDPDTLDRLAVDGPEGPVPNGAIPLGEVLE
jgi:hypothetical protein